MSEKAIPYKIYLEEHEMPTQWYNVREIGRASCRERVLAGV